MLAEYVNEVISGATWTSREAKSRYDSFKKAYQNAVQWQGSNRSGRGLTQKDLLKKIFTVQAKIESICPLFEEMDSLFGRRPNIWPPILMQTSSLNDPNYENRSISDDQESTKDNNDPSTDVYWQENDAEDPGLNETAYHREEHLKDPIYEDESPRHAKAPTSQERGVKRPSTPATPATFARPEKKQSQRKDLSTIYMEAQAQASQLEREKFDYQRLNDERTHATRIQEAKATLIRELAVSGVTDTQNIRELVEIAFPQ
ncbi:unnamed protein product [Aphanomyces euteiches]